LTRKTDKSFSYLWLILGIAIGASIGAALENIAVWTGIGAAMGIALSFIRSFKGKQK